MVGPYLFSRCAGVGEPDVAAFSSAPGGSACFHASLLRKKLVLARSRGSSAALEQGCGRETHLLFSRWACYLAGKRIG
jgi:hypothetical protein